MTTIECPMCAGEARLDEGLTALVCDGCAVSVEIAPDGSVLEAAA
jgi:hypothetical protein